MSQFFPERATHNWQLLSQPALAGFALVDTDLESVGKLEGDAPVSQNNSEKRLANSCLEPPNSVTLEGSAPALPPKFSVLLKRDPPVNNF